MPGDATPADKMDRIYRYQRFIYDLTRKPFLLGREHLIDGLDAPEHGTILEIACGTAWNLMKAARLYPTARLHGFDISQAMLETARASVARRGLSGRITLAEADATNFDPRALFGIEKFDRVFIAYALSMIPPWRAALDRAAGALAPGGSLHVVDFGRLEDLPRGAKTTLHAWLGKFSVSPREDLEAALSEVANAHQLRLEFRSLYRGFAVTGVLREFAGSTLEVNS